MAKKRVKLCRLAIESCCLFTGRVDYVGEGEEEEEKEEVVVVGYILCALS